MRNVPLGSILLSLESGGRPKGGIDGDSGGVPSLGGEHVGSDGRLKINNLRLIPRAFYDGLRRGRVQAHDILVVKDGATTGRCCILDGSFPYPDAAVNEHVFALRVDPDRACPEYVAYFLRSPEGQGAILRDFRGATVGGISRDFVRVVMVPLPSLDEQRRIGAILDLADTVRAKRRQALGHLDILARGIFFEMFGDTAKIPGNWPQATLGACTHLITDGEHLTPRRTTEGIKLLSARNVRDGYIDFLDVDFIPPEEYERISRRCKPQRGDLLISCSGTIGRVASVETDEPFALVRSAALVRPDTDKVQTKFLEQYLRTPALRSRMVREANASSQANLFQNQIRGLLVLTPPLSLQVRFVQSIERLAETRSLQQDSGRQLDALFASLQHRAFRGEV